jgi:hypothetical protein
MSILGTGEVLAHQYVVKRGGQRNVATPLTVILAKVGIRATPRTVIPAKAGIHFALARKSKWIPAFAGMTAAGPSLE